VQALAIDTAVAISSRWSGVNDPRTLIQRGRFTPAHR